MTDTRRTLLLVAFFMSLLMLWDHWNVTHGGQSMFAPQAQKIAPAKTAAAGADGAASAAGLPGAATTAAAVPAGGASAPRAEQVVVSTDVVKATLDTRGGDIVGLDLLKYQESDNHSELLRQAGRLIGRSAEPPQLHDVRIFDTHQPRFYATQTGLTSQDLPHHTTVMTLVTPERELAPGKDTLVLRFESPEMAGVKLVKTYTFHRGSYAIGVSHEVVNHSGAPVSPQLYLQLVRDGHTPPSGYLEGPSSYTGPALYHNDRFAKVDFPDLDKGKERDYVDPNATEREGWIAMVEHYFAAAWILPQNTERVYSVNRLDASANGVVTYGIAMRTPLGAIAPGASKTVDATLFAGPQEEHLLEPLAPHLEQVKDYGRLKIIAQPLFWLLDKLHTVIGNWGWSIVALVVVLKAAFYGLNASAYRSMAKMKVVAPRVQELRERYKDNPQQMQAETMKIYREEKVNPLGGCFPILIQMPIFIALFTVLTSSAEMRGAPWILWIHDLSIMDPYAILPVLMTLSSLLLTAMNPAPADPVQARLMWIMPLAFSVALFAFPSGLVLYWLSNNILTFAQQRLIQRQINGPKASAAEAKVVKQK